MTVVQPDVLYIATDRLAIISERGIEGAPTLVVEVLSPRAVGSMGIVSEQPIVIRMGADPVPDEPVLRFDCKGAVVTPHSRRPEPADLLEVERGVTGVFVQPRVRLICEGLDM